MSTRPSWWPADVDDEGYPPETRRAMALGVYVVVRCDKCDDGGLFMHKTDNTWHCTCGHSASLDEIRALLAKYTAQRESRLKGIQGWDFDHA